MPNLLLVGGNGRNVGKTHLASNIVANLSQKHEVSAIKISPHFHSYCKKNLIVENNEFVILEEKQINQKDSSRLLQAGAKKVFFVMAGQANLKKAFLVLSEILPQKAIVCESGGLHEIIDPGAFLFVKRKNEELIKNHLLEYSPKIVQNDGENFDFNIQRIQFKNNQFTIQ